MKTKNHPHTLDHRHPKRAINSLLFSIGAHGIGYGLLLMAFATISVQKTPEGTVDLGYTTLEEPPAPVKEVKLRVKLPEPAPVPKVTEPLKTPVATQELHDQKSDIAGVKTDPKTELQPATSQSTAGTIAEATPFYKIKPKYPRAALVAGVQGWVLLKIDINETGTVENVRIVDGVQRSMFQDEARRAVALWKYRPFLNPAGKPTRKSDHNVKVEFNLKET